MVQHVECVHSELEALRFRDPERFAQIRIEAPDRKPADDILSEISAMPLKGILQDDQTLVSAAVGQGNRTWCSRGNDLRHSLQQAPYTACRNLRTHVCALRIWNFRPLVRIEI